MPDRRDEESRWSSAREREERDKTRAEEREANRRARLERKNAPSPASSAPPSLMGDEPPDGPRRLTEEERQTIREYRFPTTSSSPHTPSADPSPEGLREETSPTPASDPPLSSSRRTALGTSRKWRSAVEAASSTPPASALPDLPDDGGTPAGGRGRGNNRLIAFGAILFAAMAIIAFLPFGPLGNNGADPTPTPSSTLPSILTENPGDSAATARTPEPTTAIVADNERVVCIDPGHGGWDTGWNRSDQIKKNPYAPPFVTEAELNLGMAYMLKGDLEADGIIVVMTRTSGGAVNAMEEDVNGDGQTRRTIDNPDQADQAGDRDELQARIDICNEANADILISLHLNGVDDRTVPGYEILYTAAPFRPFGDLNAELATLIYRELDTAMRGSEYGGGNGRGTKSDTDLDAVQHEFGTEEHLIMIGPAVNHPDYSITPSSMPGVVVEGAFLSNDDDARFIIQPDNQRLVVRAYAQGIIDYFDKHPG